MTSHTLEHWDNERRLFQLYEHMAVIVAEEIIGRFLNVIDLFIVSPITKTHRSPVPTTAGTLHARNPW